MTNFVLREAVDYKDYAIIRIYQKIANREFEQQKIGMKFNTVNPTAQRCKILWVEWDAIDGNFYQEPIGFFLWTDDKPPSIRQIFVDPDIRKNGHATRMIEDFLKMYPVGPIGVEEPTENICSILCKKRLMDMNEDGYVTLGRLRYANTM